MNSEKEFISLIRGGIRYLQGERPGMSAGIEPRLLSPKMRGELWDSPSILVENEVLLTDVSFWQASIDFSRMKFAGVAGTIIRAGQRNWIDTRVKENWVKAKTAGLPRGSYWFYDSREDPRKQAALWHSVIKDDPGELLHVADFEESYSGPYGSKVHMKEFLTEFQRLSGLPDNRIAVYTGFYWWAARVGNDPFFKRFALWLAWYSAMNVVRVPLPWSESDLVFWQFTSSGDGLLYGVSSREIDLNWFCCSQENFVNRFGGALTAPPPLEGETTMYKGIAPVNIDVWDKPTGEGGTKKWIIRAGSEVTGAAPTTDWVAVNSPGISGVTRKLFLGSWYKAVVVTEPPPPVEELPPPPVEKPNLVITEIYQVEGYEPKTVVVTLVPKL